MNFLIIQVLRFNSVEYMRYTVDFGWLIDCLWLCDSISVYIGPSTREREKEKRNDRRETKMPKQPHPHLLLVQ